MWRIIFGFSLLLCGCDTTPEVKCKNERGLPVDWYILYKFPRHENRGGLRYLYMDETTRGWVLGNKKINSENGVLAHSLKPLFDFKIRPTENFGFMLYSDQPPSPYRMAPASFGHSKGVLMLGRSTGVWLSHSTPNFPKKTTVGGFWPWSGTPNAQTFICMTYKHEEFQNIGVQLKYIHAYSYDYALPHYFYEELKCVASRSCLPRSSPWNRTASLRSLNGHPFRSIAKYGRFGDDLYTGVLVDSLDHELYVRSWGKMKKPLPSNCSVTHHVYNVLEVELPRYPPFPNTVDHSKWCVTAEDSLSDMWTCITDMNREESQMKRGGGAICTNNTVVWRAFYALLKTYEACPEEIAF